MWLAPGGEVLTDAAVREIERANLVAALDQADGAVKEVGIERLHLEQDAGKSIHDMDPHVSFVDLNRTGVALMEIVSRPDIEEIEGIPLVTVNECRERRGFRFLKRGIDLVASLFLIVLTAPIMAAAAVALLPGRLPAQTEKAAAPASSGAAGAGASGTGKGPEAAWQFAIRAKIVAKMIRFMLVSFVGCHVVL